MTPKIDDYNNWSFIKRYRPNKWGVFTTVFFVVAMVLIVVLADLISGLISGRGSIMRSSSINLASYSLYAIDIGSFSGVDEAENLAQSIRSQGGAGYTYHSGDYYVFVSMYQTYSDAEQVKNNLAQDGFSSRIYTINMPTIDIKLSEEERAISEGIKLLKGLYDEIYSISIEYDKGEVSRLAVVSIFTDLKKRVDDICQQVYDIVLSKNTVEAVKLHSTLTRSSQALSQVIECKDEGKLFNGLIKYCYFEEAFLYLDLAKEMG